MQQSAIYYLAYGSNLHPLRLKERIPSAQIVGVTQLHTYKLVFHKKSIDGSGKCNLVETRDNDEIAHGAIYALNPEDKGLLDQYEGKGSGYDDKYISVEYGGRTYHCFVYLAQLNHIDNELHPYRWYKELVVLGAEYLKFPDAYTSNIRNINSIEDENSDRNQQNDKLISRIHKFQP